MITLTLGDEHKKLFKETFLPTISQLIDSGKIEKPENNTIKAHHRNTLLEQGRANFDEETNGLTPQEKVDLYCYYYFQVHFSSSFIFFLHEEKLLKNVMENKLVWFIDIGCGPFTSGLAFNAWCRKQWKIDEIEVHYTGVDLSSAMIQKAKVVAENAKPVIFKSANFTLEKNELLDLPEFITSEKEILIIMNYSYVFASKYLEVDDFVDFTKNLKSKMEDYNPKFVMLKQNPIGSTLNQKWNEYKSKLPEFSTRGGYSKALKVEFKDELGSSNYIKPNFTISCDFIKNF